MTPSQLLRSVLAAASFNLMIAFGALCAEQDDRYGSWYFTAEEVDAAYQYQENYGERLRFPLNAGVCTFRDGEFLANYRRVEFGVPCHFVNEVTRHLKEMLDAGAAKYLFPLDADHAHLGVPAAMWNKKYQYLSVEKLFPALLREPGLVALYHTAEHLRITDRKTGAVNAQAKDWQEKRNVLGYFDGRPIKILSPHPEGHGVSMPEGYYTYSGFTFLASPRGELFLAAEQNFITFDMAFDADYYDERGAHNTNSAEKKMIRTEPAVKRPATSVAAAVAAKPTFKPSNHRATPIAARRNTQRYAPRAGFDIAVVE
jgi:hypothetical protein